MSVLKMQVDHRGSSGSQAEDPHSGARHGRRGRGLFGEARSCCGTSRERGRDQSPKRAVLSGPGEPADGETEAEGSTGDRGRQCRAENSLCTPPAPEPCCGYPTTLR